jgi:hypothetical protein
VLGGLHFQEKKTLRNALITQRASLANLLLKKLPLRPNAFVRHATMEHSPQR